MLIFWEKMRFIIEVGWKKYHDIIYPFDSLED